MNKESHQVINDKEKENQLLINKMRPAFRVFLNNMLGAPEPTLIGEIGVSQGFNAEVMAKHTKCKIVLVDSYEKYLECEDAEDKANKRLAKFKDKILFVKMDSKKAATQFQDNVFDYIYIDAGHDYDSISNDLKAWYPKVKPGGMLAGHDFCHRDVQDALYEFEKTIVTRLFYVGSCSTSGFENYSNMAQMQDWWLYKRMDV